MRKTIKILVATAMACLLAGVLIYSGCKKAGLEQSQTDHQQLIAAQEFSNSELVHLIKHEDPPLSDQELLGVLIAASPLDDNIIKEVLKRGQPPANAPVSDETLQLILLFNVPLSDHIKSEMEKADIEFDKNLLDNIDLADLPDMGIEKANLLLEKLLNLKYANVESEVQAIETIRDTIEVFGTLESGEYFVLSQEFIDVIDNLDLRCNGAPGSINIPCLSKNIRIVDLEIIDSLTPAGDRIIDVVLVLPIAIDKVGPASPCAFGSVDSWNFGLGDINAGGYCAPPFAGQDLFSDATMELEEKLYNCPVPFAIFIGDYTSFITVDIAPLVDVPHTLNTGDPQPNDCLYDYYLFFTTNDPGFGCGMLDDCLEAAPSLSPAYNLFTPKHEMRFYEQGAQIIANDPQLKMLNGVPANGVPIVWDLTYHIDFCFQAGSSCHSHELMVVYGIP